MSARKRLCTTQEVALISTGLTKGFCVRWNGIATPEDFGLQNCAFNSFCWGYVRVINDTRNTVLFENLLSLCFTQNPIKTHMSITYHFPLPQFQCNTPIVIPKTSKKHQWNAQHPISMTPLDHVLSRGYTSTPRRKKQRRKSISQASRSAPSLGFLHRWCGQLWPRMKQSMHKSKALVPFLAKIQSVLVCCKEDLIETMAKLTWKTPRYIPSAFYSFNFSLPESLLVWGENYYSAFHVHKQ